MKYAKDDGIWVNGRYLAPNAVSTCPRCELPRMHHASRKRNTLCVDCKTVERLIDDGEPFTGLTYRDRRGIVHMQPPVERMSRADRAWCEKAAGDHFWGAWERANRRDQNPLQAEAERRARKIRTTQTPTTKEGLAA